MEGVLIEATQKVCCSASSFRESIRGLEIWFKWQSSCLESMRLWVGSQLHFSCWVQGSQWHCHLWATRTKYTMTWLDPEQTALWLQLLQRPQWLSNSSSQRTQALTKRGELNSSLGSKKDSLGFQKLKQIGPMPMNQNTWQFSLEKATCWVVLCYHEF